MKGIDKIRHYLGAYKGNYVIIGITTFNLNPGYVNMIGQLA